MGSSFLRLLLGEDEDEGAQVQRQEFNFARRYGIDLRPVCLEAFLFSMRHGGVKMGLVPRHRPLSAAQLARKSALKTMALEQQQHSANLSRRGLGVRGQSAPEFIAFLNQLNAQALAAKASAHEAVARCNAG